MQSEATAECYGPWNPGISSTLPRDLLPLSTVFRPENVATSVEEAHELSAFCGLAPHKLVAFRAERLIVHELLVRVTADLSVPDGRQYKDLGINFRDIASVILETYIAPHQDRLVDLPEDLRREASGRIEQALARELFPETSRKPEARRAGLLRSLFGFGGTGSAEAPAAEAAGEREGRAVVAWQERLRRAQSPLDRACYDALIRVVAAVVGKRGRLIGDRRMITSLAATIVCNEHGSEVIGQAIEPLVREAVAAEGYKLLPRQDKPVVLNVKGASAAGKSTMRPLQRGLVEKLDTPWEDFALISPDIWRKFLLDYDSLGGAAKYAGTLSGHELEIVDRKLDRYMARKAADGRMSHLLIDRFRFDSFVPESDVDEASRLLTRFGELVYMYFMITPPDATVERAWNRGLKLGRYKAVDDLLHHNVEAYTGMPPLFFTWALRTRKRVHYEFLDNSVPEDCRPRTVAFGWNGEMNILDIGSMLDVDRFAKINIDATRPEDVYAVEDMAPELNVDFLKQCVQRIPIVNFADHRTGRIYARLEHGKWTWRDEDRFARVLENGDAKAGFAAIGADDYDPVAAATPPPPLDFEGAHTLGAWGPGMSPESPMTGVQ